MLLSLYFHLWFMQFSWDTALLMQFPLETEEKSTWETKLLATELPLFLKKGKSATSPRK